MADVTRGKVVFSEEVRECIQLAEAEPQGGLKTIFLAMALGWLKLDRAASASQIPN
jgi:hypothetical protein